MSTTSAPQPTQETPRWCPDPTGRHQMRWWDGVAWTGNVADGQQQSMDPLATMPPPTAAATVPTPPAAAPALPATPEQTDWRTRPESIGAFLGTVLFCTLFPIVALWYGPKYVMRHEYVKAIICVAAPIIAIIALSALMAA